MNRRSFFGRALAALAVVPGMGWIGARKTSHADFDEIMPGLLERLSPPPGWRVVSSSVTTASKSIVTFDRHLVLVFQSPDSLPGRAVAKQFRDHAMRPFMTANGRHAMSELHVYCVEDRILVRGVLGTNLAS